MNIIVKKIITTAVLCAFMSVCCVYAAALLHNCLSDIPITADILKPEYVKAAFEDEGCRFIFKSLEGCVLIYLIASAMMDVNLYHSSEIKIAQGIKIPAPAGQGQYGQAWFLTRKEREKKFAAAKLSRLNPVIDELVKRGYDDLDLGKDSDTDED